MKQKLKDLTMAYFQNLTLRGILNWLIVIIALIALVRGCYQEKKYSDLIEQTQKVKPKEKTETTTQAEEIGRQIDTAGRERVVYRMAEPIIKEIVNNSKVDSLLKEVKIEKSNVRQVVSINGKLEKENTDLKRYISEIKANGERDTLWRYTDQWLTLTGTHKNDTIFRITELEADASVNKIDHTYKKYWLFGRNENRSTIWFNSPYVKPYGLNNLIISQPEPLLDFSIKVGGKYLHKPGELLIGPKVELNIGRFGINGGYYLNPGGKIGNTLYYGAEYTVY